ncbi:MAG: hypothetical protein GF411_00470 [Candidatus Lokiarchaeota archaeon]|nr:hypothetical protein [Candidatus Lokiarchaeota archaeon]
MRLVGCSHGIDLFAPEDSYFSYFNSPYIGHRRFSAIDIYSAHNRWEESFVSPVSGKVTKIRKLTMGRKREFPTSDHDYAIGIQPDGHEDIVRILHCKPNIDIGEYVEQGEHLGFAIRSRYFNFWTGPHIHVEVQKRLDFIRSSQSYPLEIPSVQLDRIRGELRWPITCEVVEVSKDNIKLVSYQGDICTGSGLIGHCVESENAFGIIDIGFPHYKQGAMIFPSSEGICNSFRLWSILISSGSHSMKFANVFSTKQNIRFRLDEDLIRGLSFYVFSKHQEINGRPPIIVIPEDYGAMVDSYKKGDIVSLSFS